MMLPARVTNQTFPSMQVRALFLRDSPISFQLFAGDIPPRDAACVSGSRRNGSTCAHHWFSIDNAPHELFLLVTRLSSFDQDPDQKFSSGSVGHEIRVVLDQCLVILVREVV